MGQDSASQKFKNVWTPALMDDLALQFDGTDAGKRFIEAWKRARIIVDTGGGHTGTPPTPPTPPATPKP